MQFNELSFVPSQTFPNCIEAIVKFPNGWGARIAGGPIIQGDGINTFELEVLWEVFNPYTHKLEWEVVLFNNLCDYSLPYLDKDQIEAALADIMTFVRG